MTSGLEQLRLYSYWRSSCSWRVRIALELQERAYDYVAVHLVKDGGEQLGDDYTARNPMQQVPTLEWIEGGQVQRMTQSLAILEMLSERGPALWPDDPALRARGRELAEIVNSGIQPLQNLKVLKLVESLGGDRKAHGAEVIAKGLAAMERIAAGLPLGGGPFLLGDAPSIADLCLVPQLYNAERFELALDAFPTLLRAREACAALPAFERAHPDKQPDRQ